MAATDDDHVEVFGAGFAEGGAVSHGSFSHGVGAWLVALERQLKSRY
jgi:hypothetical protein